MSKSKKKQVARAREQAAAAAAPAVEAIDLDDDDDLGPPDPDATRPAEAGASGQAVDEALFETIAEAVHQLGEDREEGDQVAWVWNGPTLAIKYVEAEGDLPRRMMVAAFRRGVVFQVEGDRQVVRQDGEWLAELAAALGAGA